MLTRFAKHAIENHLELGLPEAWLIGAKAALNEMSSLKVSREWLQFYSEIEEFVNWWDDIEPMSLERVLLTKCLHGSLFDYIGGYTSVAGTLTDDGIRLGIARKYHHDLKLLLTDMVIIDDHYLLVPNNSVGQFLNLVTIIGPLFDDLKEVLQ